MTATTGQTLYYEGNYRTEAQLAQMRRLEAEGICLFCPENLAQDPVLRVLHKTAQWTVTPNAFPYRNTTLHLLMIPDAHVTDIADLSPEAQQDFWNALGWIRDHYGLTYYSMVSRNGLCEYTGGTIRHVHLHILQGDVENPDHEPIRTRLSSRRS